MANTIQTSINWAQCFLNFWNPTVGTSDEPAITAANMTQQVMLGPPFAWPWNRNSTSFTTTGGTQDYTESLTDFGYLETATVALAGGQTFSMQVLNTTPLGESVDQQRPNMISVKLNTIGSSVVFRLLGVPDTTYTVTLTYQKFVSLMTTLSTGWTPPDYLSYVYNRGFLAHLYEAKGDVRAQQEKIGFAAALLANQGGLSDTEKNIFLAQYLPNDRMTLVTQSKAQQSVQARGQ